MPNREFVMLATDFNRAKHRVAGMYLSEKLDGFRCLWLPITARRRLSDLPFANRDRKKAKSGEAVATGLWSRYGNIINCPPWFTEGWPDYPLDGELYAGRGAFQKVMSTCRKDKPVDEEWTGITYNVFEAPLYEQVFADGRINNPNYIKTIKLADNLAALGLSDAGGLGVMKFDFMYKLLQRDLVPTATMRLHKQQLLPFITAEAIAILDRELEAVTNNDGEGLMLRHPASEWEPVRSGYLLKVKKLLDSEGVVVGFKSGEGKYLGMMGSVRLAWNGVEFDLSGFTDAERTLTPAAALWAKNQPGQSFYDGTEPVVAFHRGDRVTFRYREVSDDGLPKEARYWRKQC